MTLSAITAADEAFTVLAVLPAPLAFDARGIEGLPDRHLDLLELRAALTGRGLPVATTDVVWRRLAAQARAWGAEWVVAAVGVAVPGLRRVAVRLTAGCPQLAEDIDSEVVAGFLTELRAGDVQPPRVWLRLLWAAWRSGQAVLRVHDTTALPEEIPSWASTPRRPYGHPDLLLGRAVVAGVITAEQAALIGETRLGEVLVEQLADEQGVSAPVLRMRRQRAEQALLAALSRGSVGDLVRPARPGRDGPVQLHRLSGTACQKPEGAVRNRHVRLV
jgi:hypothetical protein